MVLINVFYSALAFLSRGDYVTVQERLKVYSISRGYSRVGAIAW